MNEEPVIDEARRRYDFKKTLERLESKEGSGTELITLYIPPDKQIYDVTAQLRDEFGQCSNIKSKQTRTNVQSAISSILSRLKYYKRPPEKGMAIFCGTILLGGDRSDLECTVIEPPEPLNLYMYRCSSNFELEPLRQMLEEKSIYGLLVRWTGVNPTGAFSAATGSIPSAGRPRRSRASSEKAVSHRWSVIGPFPAAP